MKNIFSGVIAADEINKGRQVEFDYSKGLFLFMILLIHSFQVAGKGAGTEALAYRIIYMFGSMTGASIFIFVMGLGTSYSKAGAGDMLRSGGRLFLYQYLGNIAWAAASALPFFVLLIFKDMSSVRDEVISTSWLLLLYINIFFISGGIYMVLALLKRLKTPIWAYVALGLVINIFSPALIGLSTGNAAVDYILGGIFGGTKYASFSILNYLPYAFFGLAFGKLLRRVADKKRFYTMVCLFSTALLALFAIWLFTNHPTFDTLYPYLSRTYIMPDFIRTIANTSAVMLLAGLLFFASPAIAKRERINRTLMYYNKHTSKYYAIHATFFFLAYGFNGYRPFGFWGCMALFVLCVIYTDTVVKLYNHKRA